MINIQHMSCVTLQCTRQKGIELKNWGMGKLKLRMGDDTDTYKHRRQSACNVSVSWVWSLVW